MSAPFPARRERLRACLTEEGLDGLLITNPVNVTYLTGFSGDSSYLILTRQRELLVSDGRYTTQLAEECPGLPLHIRPPGQPLPDATAQVLQHLGLCNVGIESGHLTVAELRSIGDQATSIQWKGERDRVERLRMIKDSGEIEEIRHAIAVAEKAFAMFRAMLRGRDSEKDLADAMEMYVRRAGGQCTSFPTIVACGERAALPHAPPTERKVDETNLVLVDWGAVGRHYRSDLTRVLLPARTVSSGTIPPRNGEQIEAKLREVYSVVLRAQERAVATVRAGVTSGEVDAAARGVISDAGYGEYFTHSTGHGIGLQVHEAPLLRPGSAVVLQAGMVVTIEPGIYLPGWGGVRIEDDVLVTEDGCAVLTHVPRDLPAQLVEV